MSIILRLPKEIQEDVILKTPAKSIFTCKCVCKLWRDVISSSEYIRDHLNKLISPNMNLTSFIFVSNSSLCYVEYDFENDEQFCQKPTKESFNLGSVGYFNAVDKGNIIIVGSCNGLVCLTTKIDDYLCGHVYICNPLTQECLQLPSLVPNNEDYKDAGYYLNFYGFGYLHSRDEYKVVRITYKLNSKNTISSGKVHVYTLGDGKGWRDRGKTINQLYWSHRQGIPVDGAVYWIRSGDSKLAVFDLTEEKLYMFHAPPRSPLDWGQRKMVLLGEQLCIFQVTTYESSDIWLLKKKKIVDDNSDVKQQDGKDKHSSWIWSKGSTVRMEDIQKYQPLTITKNGDILLLYREKWNQAETNNVVIQYDAKTSDSKELGDLGLPLPGYGKATTHVNSYISLKSLGEQTVFGRLRS